MAHEGERQGGGGGGGELVSRSGALNGCGLRVVGGEVSLDLKGAHGGGLSLEGKWGD